MVIRILSEVLNNDKVVVAPSRWSNFGYNPDILTNELLILSKFQQTDPDNIIVVFNDLQELSFLNRIYSDDELLCVSEVGAYLK